MLADISACGHCTRVYIFTHRSLFLSGVLTGSPFEFKHELTYPLLLLLL